MPQDSVYHQICERQYLARQSGLSPFQAYCSRGTSTLPHRHSGESLYGLKEQRGFPEAQWTATSSDAGGSKHPIQKVMRERLSAPNEGAEAHK
jgi:hypothetical protein